MPMYRLIYSTANNNYRTFDSADNTEIDSKDEMLNKQGLDVICLVDYERQLISKKCPNYAQHIDLIDHLIFDPRFVKN
jgi:hypothetical protein